MSLERYSAALPASATGFITPYVQYAAACSDAPVAYHIGVALTVLASAVSGRIRCPWLAGRSLTPNLYTVLVGPSRSARKTGSIDIGVDLLNIADQSLVTPIPGSYEELIAQIRRKNVGLLTYREFGHFLKTTSRGYGEPIRTVLMDLYDWPPDRPYERNLKKERTVVEAGISLSMIAGIATELLFAYSDLESWIGGFFGRFLVLYGERDEFRLPATWPQARDYLGAQLAHYIGNPIGICGGFAPDAWQAFAAWSAWRDENVEEFEPRVRTFVAGSITLAAKIALLYAVDDGTAFQRDGWLVTYEHMYRAAQFVETLYLPSIKTIGERLQLSIYERERQRVLDAIPPGEIGISQRRLTRVLKLDVDTLARITHSLEVEGTIHIRKESRPMMYVRVERGKEDDQKVVVALPYGRSVTKEARDGEGPAAERPPEFNDYPNG